MFSLSTFRQPAVTLRLSLSSPLCCVGRPCFAFHILRSFWWQGNCCGDTKQERNEVSDHGVSLSKLLCGKHFLWLLLTYYGWEADWWEIEGLEWFSQTCIIYQKPAACLLPPQKKINVRPLKNAVLQVRCSPFIWNLLFGFENGSVRAVTGGFSLDSLLTHKVHICASLLNHFRRADAWLQCTILCALVYLQKHHGLITDSHYLCMTFTVGPQQKSFASLKYKFVSFNVEIVHFLFMFCFFSVLFLFLWNSWWNEAVCWTEERLFVVPAARSAPLELKRAKHCHASFNQ